ncbi:maleylpyruvate isomerase family mycothiol-dependent enzyme [Nocardioides sp.]|uniref:maleylpyruvate isomerase family mycothiol-dependent enzyme n=1 Tax=Nocardioides sp. TaxID=35761 RepID=UPI002721B7CA|nr:maleylpyruvate isomerase family mycothiol-dependent enzyme [Nocardioides sp.]MDO9457730.1 maleylpyruvate isomerase family mycothiol-dependent enzyme [Nocardioides sp.]
MATTLTFDEHLAGFQRAMLELARAAGRSGLDVPVPSCPAWTVRRLVGHQGAVHRWAAGSFRGEDLDWPPIEKAGRSSSDPVDWLRDGAIALVRTLVGAADDAEAAVFLHDAPPPRQFWARRQCHETTIHAVDVLSAALGRLPRTEETWLTDDRGRALALDGIDELLLGFVPRSRSRLRSATPVTIAVVPTDADHSFTVRVTDEPPVSTRVEGHVETAEGDLRIEGTAAQLYLALWHRTDELTSDIWPLWHDSAVL